MIGPSRHLSWAELACHDGTPYPEAWRTTRAPVLAQEFEAIRAACGDRPLVVLSAYRTAAHNRRVGGARASQHLEGRALDLRPPHGLTVSQLVQRVRSRAESAGIIRGIGLYRRFVHVDVRLKDRLVVWHGARPAAEVT